MSETQTQSERAAEIEQAEQRRLYEQSREQCAMCLGYFDTEGTEQPIICKGCLDKAAAYDIVQRQRDYATQTFESVIPAFEKLAESVGNTMDPSAKMACPKYFDNVAEFARLRAMLVSALHYCKPTHSLAQAATNTINET